MRKDGEITCKHCLNIIASQTITIPQAKNPKKRKSKKKCCRSIPVYDKARCARAPYADNCDHSDGLYLSTSYTMYNPDKKAPSSMKVEKLLREHGYKGKYRDSRDDPHAHSEWLCRPHFMESEFGFVEVKCPRCKEDFAFDHSHFYTDDSYVKCPKCSSVLYGRVEKEDVSVDEMRKWWANSYKQHIKIFDKFLDWLNEERRKNE